MRPASEATRSTSIPCPPRTNHKPQSRHQAHQPQADESSAERDRTAGSLLIACHHILSGSCSQWGFVSAKRVGRYSWIYRFCARRDHRRVRRASQCEEIETGRLAEYCPSEPSRGGYMTISLDRGEAAACSRPSSGLDGLHCARNQGKEEKIQGPGRGIPQKGGEGRRGGVSLVNCPVR